MKKKLKILILIILLINNSFQKTNCISRKKSMFFLKTAGTFIITGITLFLIKKFLKKKKNNSPNINQNNQIDNQSIFFQEKDFFKNNQKILDHHGNNGYFATNKLNQKIYYLKFIDNNNEFINKYFFINEYISTKVYNLLEIKSPKPYLLLNKNNNINGLALEEIKDFKSLGTLEIKCNKNNNFLYSAKDNYNKLNKSLKEEIKNLFMINVWLRNWDMIGGHDSFGNIGISDNKIVQLDFGGCLLYRALGQYKNNNKVNILNIDNEIKGLRTTDINPAANLFQNLTKENIKNGIEIIRKIKDKDIYNILDSLKEYLNKDLKKSLYLDLLINRRKIILKYLDKTFRYNSISDQDFNKEFLLPEKNLTNFDYSNYSKNEPEDIAGSHVIIEEDDDKVWIIKPKDSYGSYKYSFPGGKKDKNENLMETAIREVKEESGLNIIIKDFLGDFNHTTSKKRYFIGKRIGGNPSNWKTNPIDETEAVLLVDKKNLEIYFKENLSQKTISCKLNILNQYTDYLLNKSHQIILENEFLKEIVFDKKMFIP